MGEFVLKKGAHIHLMGIGGTAMTSFAGILQKMGYKVTGSDQNEIYPPMSKVLKDLKIEVKKGYKKENLHPHPDLVIVGNVISAHFEEAKELKRLNLPYTSFPKALGELILSHTQRLMVCGTHGKTTTSSFLAKVCESCGKDFGFLIGGILKDYESSYKLPQNLKESFFVLEGDEYDTSFFDKVPKFIHYKPFHVILTGIEFDHADIYKDLEDVKKAFTMLLEKIPEEGTLIIKGGDKNIESILSSTKCRRIVTYGPKGSHYEMVEKKSPFEFTLKTPEGGKKEVRLSLYGEHNFLNALGAFALFNEMGWEESKILEGLKSFKGVKRRGEVIGEPQGITVIDDFAHHPTAVKLTLNATKERYKGRRIFAVFEPRSATSRRDVFQEDYVESFSSGIHEILIVPPFGLEKIEEGKRFSSKKLVQDLSKRGEKAKLIETVPDLIFHLKKEAKPQDVILIMSNGGFEGLYKKLLDELSKK